MKKKLILLNLILLVGVLISSCNKKDDDTPAAGDATLTGTIINSQTGTGLANATLYFTRNLNATDYSNADYTVTTDGNGNFTLTNATTGNYICFVVANGFFVRSFPVTMVSGDNTLGEVTIVDSPETGELRIVLVWGVSPSDLDSHLTGPDGSGGRFHMYYSQKTPNQYISLDVDDRDGYGPETTTISGLFDGMYRFSVHNFSDRYQATARGAIVTSPARVELYDHTGLVATFNPPTFTGNGDTWRVFELTVSGTSVSYTTINTYTLASDVHDGNDFKSNKKEDIQFEIADF